MNTEPAAFDTELVDERSLAAWMDLQNLGGGPLESPIRLTGGTQNVLLSFTRSGRRFVLRRPPVVPRPGNDETMLREARVLGALAGSDVPHPDLIAVCADTAVIGTAFYLMESVDGFNAINGLPALHASDPAIRREMGYALVEAAAKLGQIDYLAAGLGDFGKPANYLERQVDRWSRQLAGYHAHAGWPGPESLGSIAVVSEYLTACLPASFQPGILHGDYSIGNVMYRHDGPALAAIVDWELATIGDPLIDLGWVIATWRDIGGPKLEVLQIEPWTGFPSAGALVERYAALSHRDLTAIDWYVVMACYKLAILLEGTFARACSGAANPETGRRLHRTAVALIERALYRIEHPGHW
ncbi:phosphotransferase family protein [Nevskia ramosa]|uniref:phosphotransferase family protein n=1 Tax=Nevskia ramosa TaxID=64002 RepID=UPI003D112CC1